MLVSLGRATDQPLQNNALDQGVEKIFVKHCFECHAGDSAESGFQMDADRDRFLYGGDSGKPAVVQAAADQSQLFRLIKSSDESVRMPPEGDRLSDLEIEIVRRWINDGAKITTPFQTPEVGLWSFRPIVKPEIPLLPWGENGAGRNLGPIDAFVLDKLTKNELKFSPPAEKRELIRRLFLVMLGVPPTPEDVDGFLRDTSPDAYERLVSYVLSSSGFGERWAQHWVDIVRFGETHGFETNRERPNAWYYRDYVIDSLNSDKPYDLFIKEQIAGDQLSADVATGFIVAGPHDIVKSPDINLTLMQRQDELADIVNVAGTTFLGLTVGCARCHNHKFDPISQKDFYSMQAVFAGTNHADRQLAVTPAERARLVDVNRAIQDRLKELAGFVRRPAEAMILIDDDQEKGAARIEYLKPPKGKGINPAGGEPGFANDVGSSTRSFNISGGRYTWWKNQPGHDLAVYHPNLVGVVGVWLSWGAGIATHSSDAIYQLDRDGDLNTLEDRVELACIDQRLLAGGKGKIGSFPLWSGFFHAGIHELTTKTKIVLRGGSSGAVVTADSILLEPGVELANHQKLNVPLKPFLRGSVQTTQNVDRFPPIKARYLRFTIEKSSASEPCIDELEVFSADKDGDQNIALASLGANASSSGDFQHPLHKLAHINDGQYGNSNSWISSKSAGGWVQIEFPEIRTIHRVEWGRDREGGYSDRLPTHYRIEVATEEGKWRPVAGSGDRKPFGKGLSNESKYHFSGLSSAAAAAAQHSMRELDALKKKKASLSQNRLAYSGTFSQPQPTHRLYRGDPLEKREVVAPDTIAKLGELGLQVDSKEPARRLAFANWLVRKDNPLVARVMVNRLWQHTFGQGIVGTPNDFGNMGLQPSHPRLLDWLAMELIESDWSLKHVQKLILTSRAFRQSSRPHPEGLAIDAGGELLWRFSPRRLAAETIRDSMLEVSGVLNHRIGGKGFSGFEVQMENVRHFFPKSNYGPTDWRRMIYMTKVRQEKDSVFGAFDCPDASQIIDRRSRSITPLQALNLFNSRFVLQQADILAERLTEGSFGTDEVDLQRQVSQAFQILYSRPAGAKELKQAIPFIKDYGWPAFCRALLNSNEFLFIQ